MLITRVLTFPCPRCETTGEYGNVHISNDVLLRGCNACGHRIHFQLPKLQKTVIYLDQFFLSHAFRRKIPEFVRAAERINDLARRQLLVCPRSSTHELETHLWRHPDQKALWKFIRRTARGHQFHDAISIKIMQLQRSFLSYLNSTKISCIYRSDAFESDVNKWDDYLSVYINTAIDDYDNMRDRKLQDVARLVSFFDEWRKEKSNFCSDCLQEANHYAELLLHLFFVATQQMLSGDIQGWKNGPAEGDFVQSLLSCMDRSTDVNERFEQVEKYFSSEYFRQTPFLDIKCQLFAILRKKVRAGSYTNEEKAKKKLSGLYNDIDAISIFAPYCDAVFIDSEMSLWLKEPEMTINERYPFQVFSPKTWPAFHEFLDNVEAQQNNEIRRGINVVEGLE